MSNLLDLAFYESIRGDSIAVHLWTHINLYAATEATEVKVGNKMVVIPAGSLLTSRIELSKLIGVDQHKIDRLLKMLINCKKVEQQTTTKYRLISITNYCLHNSSEQQMSNKRATTEQPIKKVIKPLSKFTDDDYALAEYIFLQIKNVAIKTKRPDLDKWANVIRLMREQDNLQHDEIKNVFTWANKDSFWKTNILSPTKLRDKFPSLEAKAASTGYKNEKVSQFSEYHESKKKIGSYIEEQGRAAAIRLSASPDDEI